MEIAHQLPGRLRVRMAELESDSHCRKISELLERDERITGHRISADCNSLILFYDPTCMDANAVLEMLSGIKPVGETATSSKPQLDALEEKTPSGKPQKAFQNAPRAGNSEYFKPAVAPNAQERIRQMIASEDSTAPLSDGRISELLKAEDMGIARRTVAKYRELMGILPSHKRRKENG